TDPSVSLGPDRTFFRYNRASEGTCLCSYECPSTSHVVSDLLVGSYPAFSPSHTYTVTLDLGAAAAQRLNFAPFDCGRFDNSGSYTVTSEAGAASTPTTMPGAPTTTSVTSPPVTTTTLLAGRRSKKRCRQACGAAIGDCFSQGGRPRACKRRVIRLCREVG